MVSSRGLSTCRTCHEGLALDFHLDCTACEAGCVIESKAIIEGIPRSSSFSNAYISLTGSNRVSPSSPYSSLSPPVSAASAASASNSVLSPAANVLSPLNHQKDTLAPIKDVSHLVTRGGSMLGRSSPTTGRVTCHLPNLALRRTTNSDIALATNTLLEQRLISQSPPVNIPSISSVYKEASWTAQRSSSPDEISPARYVSNFPMGSIFPSSPQIQYPTLVSTKLKTPHNNTPYSEEQTHFITHQKNLKNVKNSAQRWQAIATLFVLRWPGRKRTSDSMSSVFYRDQLIPRLNSHGKLMYDRNGKPIMKKYNVRLQDKTIEGYRFREYFDFLTRNPEEALTYDWVTPQEKAHARRIIASRKGLRLPGSTKAGRADTDDRSVQEKMFDRSAQDIKKAEKEVLEEQASEYRKLNGCLHHSHDNGEEDDSYKLVKIHAFDGIYCCHHCARHTSQSNADIRDYQSREWQKLHKLPHRSDIQNSDIAHECEEGWSFQNMIREHGEHVQQRARQDSRKAYNDTDISSDSTMTDNDH